MNTELTPVAKAIRAHARLSPSGSKRWFSCPGSIVLAGGAGSDASEYSDNGTAMHNVASHVLGGKGITFMVDGVEVAHSADTVDDFIGEMITVSLPHEPLRQVWFKQEFADIVNGYVDAVREIVGDLVLGEDWFVEERVEFTRFVTEPGEEVDEDDKQFGTADVIILKGRELIVIDLKTGFKYVEVQHNTQALFYALGAWDRFSLTHDIETVRAMVYQPAHGGMHEWAVPVGDMS